MTSGSSVDGGVEGTRPLLVEIQALVDHLDDGEPAPRGSGAGTNRLAILLGWFTVTVVCKWPIRMYL